VLYLVLQTYGRSKAAEPAGASLPGGLFVNGTVTPELVDRYTADNVGFGFNAPLGVTIPPGATSVVLVIHTNAANFKTGKVNIIDGGVSTVNGFMPTAPIGLVLTKAFADSEIQLFGLNSTSLSFTLTNSNTGTMLTGLAFTDALPSGLIVSTPNGLTGSCGGATITAIAGSNSISLSGATLAAGASCSFSVNVTGIAIGVQINTTSTVTSNEAPPGSSGHGEHVC
jgi:hypothetical protein